MMKKGAYYTIDEKLLDDFDVITRILKDVKSEIVEAAIRDYVVQNKAKVNEMMKVFENLKNNE